VVLHSSFRFGLKVPGQGAGCTAGHHGAAARQSPGLLHRRSSQASPRGVFEQHPAPRCPQGPRVAGPQRRCVPGEGQGSCPDPPRCCSQLGRGSGVPVAAAALAGRSMHHAGGQRLGDGTAAPKHRVPWRGRGSAWGWPILLALRHLESLQALIGRFFSLES